MKSLKLFSSVFLVLLSLIFGVEALAAYRYYKPGAYPYYTPRSAQQALADKIGVCHADGFYSFSSEPYLLEGARAIRETGSRVIKVFLQHPGEKYKFNSSWPNDRQIINIVDVLKTNYFKALFDMDFSVFVLQAHLDTVDSNYWIDGVDANEYKLIENNYYQAAKYLLTTYANKPVSFILEHWEAELYYSWCLELGSKRYSAEQLWNAQNGFLTYLDARHKGVERARREAGGSMARVFSAVEVIYVSSHQDDFRLIDHMDKVQADYIAYSAGLECGTNTQAMKTNLGILKSRIGGRTFYIGELQIPESDFSTSEAQAKATESQINTALEEGSQFVLLWQIYENESLPDGRDRGFALIRRDGSKTALYNRLSGMLQNGSNSGAVDNSPLYHEDEADEDFSIHDFGEVQQCLGQQGNTARGAVIILKNDLDFRQYQADGWVMHTSRVPYGKIGDTSAFEGEEVSIWIPDEMPAFFIK